MAQVIVLARYEDEVMEPLTRPDQARSRQGCFMQIPWFVRGGHIAGPPSDVDPGFLVRTGLGRGEDRHSPEHVQDPRSSW
ncbi:hypothetical protein GPZ77_16380 [Streptomyces sp. QHH-9511]|nr:hypothetical protein GPZ77_16380 [Streptomyces sp. QHH-9511]GGT69479.1 hypothetical protein GCM10010272_10690 [Streptomyces lateritius]